MSTWVKVIVIIVVIIVAFYVISQTQFGQDLYESTFGKWFGSSGSNLAQKQAEAIQKRCIVLSGNYAGSGITVEGLSATCTVIFRYKESDGTYTYAGFPRKTDGTDYTITDWDNGRDLLFLKRSGISYEQFTADLLKDTNELGKNPDDYRIIP